MRLFVALPLPQAIRKTLASLCAGLPGARWVPPENMHVTLRFLGELSGDVIDDVDAALSGISAPAFSLALGGVGHFGNGARPRAIWAGVARDPALFHLHDKIESAVVRAGLAPDRQKFTPHVTLSRPKGTSIPKLQDYLSAHSLFRSDPWEVSRFTLFSSFLAHTNAIYREESRYPLLRGWSGDEYDEEDAAANDGDDAIDAIDAEAMAGQDGRRRG